MRSAICPGSFDPITYGHLDIISRASALYDQVVVAVLVNHTKASMFTVEARMEMIREVTREFPNVRVDSWSGLLVDYCKAHKIPAIVKGLRAVSDFEYELQMAQMNHQLADIETVFISTSPQYSFLRSSLVKEVARYGGDVSAHVPPNVLDQLLARLKEEAS